MQLKTVGSCLIALDIKKGAQAQTARAATATATIQMPKVVGYFTKIIEGGIQSLNTLYTTTYFLCHCK